MVDAKREIVLDGVRYYLSPDRGKRDLIRRPRSAQASDPGEIKKAEWQLSGPIGQSRESADGFLGHDYSNNLDTRYDQLITSGPARTNVPLSSPSAATVGVPISDVDETNWSEGAGDGDGDHYDELDETTASADDATTYWTSTTNGANITQVMTSMTDPGYHDNHYFRVRARHSSASGGVGLTLRQGTTHIGTKWFNFSAADTWETIEWKIPAEMAALLTDYTTIQTRITKLGTGTMDLSAVDFEVPAATSGNVIAILENYGFIEAIYGSRITHIEQGTQQVVTGVNATEHILFAAGPWNGQTYIASGEADVLKRESTLAALTDVTSTNGEALAIAGDRIWFLDGGDSNKAKFAVGALESNSDHSNGVEVVPQGAEITGMFGHDEYVLVGHTRGLNSFTNSGRPRRLLEFLRDHPSRDNCRSGDSFGGWFYIATSIGLYAVDPEGLVANPVGPGEGLEGAGFEGDVDGFPTAVRVYKDSLFVAYQTTGGATYVLRGMFGPQTAQSGRLLWFPFDYQTSIRCDAIGYGSGNDNPLLVTGSGDDVDWYLLGRRGRDIDDGNYVFATTGGTWFGSTLTRAPSMLKNVRSAYFVTENCDGSNTWQLAVSADGGSYVNVGSAVSSDGMAEVFPVSGSTPLTTVNGYTIKPRLTQVAASTTSPPQIRGNLTIVYDERPATIVEVTARVRLDRGQTDLDLLEALADDATASPTTVRLPDQADPTTDQYCFVTSVETEDSDSDERVATVTMQLWRTS